MTTPRCGRRSPRTASPLKRGRDAIAPKPAKVTAPATKAKPQRPFRDRARAKACAETRSVPRAAPLDRQTSRQLDKGRIEVEARLDLHGMRQRDAHAQLRRFLKTAQAQRAQACAGDHGQGCRSDASRSFYEEDERGVLRQAVPHWLADPEFASLVVSFSQAPRRLGGDGALYVRLRKPRPG